MKRVPRHRDFKSPRMVAVLAVSISFTVLVIFAVGIGVYGLIVGPPAPPPQTPTFIPQSAEQSGNPGSQSQDTQSAPNGLAPVVKTVDPEQFASRTAVALFEWDTVSGHAREDYRARILDVADPTGAETPGLVADLENYLPPEDAWKSLTQYQTSQRLDIDTVVIPGRWSEAARLSPREITEGMWAYTVTGTRHREGIWEGKPAASEHRVSFTMFVACPPATTTCALLRLSELDNPLS